MVSVEKQGRGEMTEALTVKNDGQALTAADVRGQVNLIQTVMKEVMQEGQHYGVVPGCKKPSLWKPGAEKISMTFRLRPIINAGDVQITQLGNGHREIMVSCHVLNADGLELATGIGSCSTMENKYRYRGGEKKPTGRDVPREYWNLKKDGQANEAQELIGGRGFGAAKIDGKWEIVEMGEKQENPDIADTYNTVLKMAKKRAYIDGILSATAASDIFTQDIEELSDAAEEHVEHKPPVEMPKRKQPDTSTAEKVPGGDGVKVALINDGERAHLFATADENFVSKESLHEHLKSVYRIESTKDIRKAWFSAIIDWLKNGGKNIEDK
jgi:hypothetical protein